MDTIQDDLDKRLSRRAQFEYGSFYRKKIAHDVVNIDSRFRLPAGSKRVHWKDVCRRDFRSAKSNTKGRSCVNFVIVQLANGYTSTILFPGPAKNWNDSVCIHSGYNPDQKNQLVPRVFHQSQKQSQTN